MTRYPQARLDFSSLPGLTRQSIDFRKKMDARVKPAHDELIEHSRGALGMHVPVEIGGKSVAARRHARIVGKVRRVGAVMVGKPERPSALRRHGDRRRRADQDYVRSFSALYGRGPERAHVLDALATFQRSLLTPNARFDRYLNGQHDAITLREQRGYQLFKTYGCIACHQGMNLGGNLLQRFGVFDNPFTQRGRVTDADLGRFVITGIEDDRYVFRVPSLRNVAVTAPYFHDGSASTLAEAVDIMARVQLGRDLPSKDIDLIVEFLGTLTGEYQGRSLAAEMNRSTR